MRLFLFLSAILLFICISATARAATVWSDSFESGFANWTSSDGNWTTTTSSLAAHTGTKGANIAGPSAILGDSLTLAIPTTGYYGLTLSYWYKVREALEASDSVTVEWSDGLGWQTLAIYSALPTADWQYASFVLPLGAMDNPNFTFRFRANLGSTTDRMNFDDVVLMDVPEPTTFLLLGLPILLVCRRKRI